MKPAAPKTTRRRVTAGLAAAALLGATGCSFVNPQATTISYAPSDGIVEDVGDAELRNLMLISSGPEAPGRYLGAVHNDSDEPLEVVITVEGTSTRLSVPAGELLQLSEPQNEHIIPDTGTFPGSMAEATIEAGGTTENVLVPVLDGTLEVYRPYVPGGWNPDTIEHLYTTPAAPEDGGH